MPYRKHRYAVASFLGVDESYLWPDALSPEQVASASHSEIVTVYPHRWAVPRDAWGRLFAEATREIGVLVYSGLFLSEDAGTHQVFRAKADAGVRVRILLGDPESPAVAQRSAVEGVDSAMAAKIRNALVTTRSTEPTTSSSARSEPRRHRLRYVTRRVSIRRAEPMMCGVASVMD